MYDHVQVRPIGSVIPAPENDDVYNKNIARLRKEDRNHRLLPAMKKAREETRRHLRKMTTPKPVRIHVHFHYDSPASSDQ
jgi:hypothetical protein